MIRFSGGDGTGKSNAIKIVGAKTDWDGVASEYYLVRQVFKKLQKKWELLFQELIHENERSYDRLVLRDEDGKVSEIWFDIKDCFGKW